ncbi:uncharacterized protein LOC111118972 [Crassostrea virginica]|uniref:Uncharacterized protein LOC111118972 n=1 Tax=Crassostrea virginica TaxID=6565 RepID=A0A8B8CIZ0_CRAVI|nr:uncharacterized protein LOC111118972 [Crassostrea virginica]
MLAWTQHIFVSLKDSYRYLKVYRKCRVLVKGNIPIATALSKPTDGGIPYKTSGIYVFKQRRTVIYLGMSSNDIRNRVQAHVSNNDRQEVGRYLQKWYFRTVTVSWVEEQNAEVKEKLYMDIVSILQGRTPVLNKTSGNSKKAPKKTLFQRIFK